MFSPLGVLPTDVIKSRCTPIQETLINIKELLSDLHTLSRLKSFVVLDPNHFDFTF